MVTELLGVVPVLPSQSIQRDTQWYFEHTGFETVYMDDLYAVLRRELVYIHLQWHEDTEEDPLLGGSVVRIFVNEIQTIFEEFIKRGTVHRKDLKMNTAWGTNEFGFYDLNNNAVFMVMTT